jgi:hypothetical protein
MSSIGTGMAAGLAQTAQQSQRLSRAGDQRRTQAAQQQDETNERVDRLLKAGETADADAELPDRGSAGYEQLYRQPRPDDTASDDTEPADASADRGHDEPPRFEHVDVKA